MAAAFAYDGFREAMDWYEKAHDVRPEGDDDATLRWNSCVPGYPNQQAAAIG